MKERLTLCVLICALLNLQLTAQDAPKAGKISPQDFQAPASPAITSNSNAVILADIGITDFKGNEKGWFSYVFRRRTRILFLTKKAFDLATVHIPLYNNEEDKEKLSELTATTYNLENGSVQATPLPKADIFTVKSDKNHSEQKFTMPAVKEGSIIEYSYTITSPFTFNMPSWEFQRTEAPSIWSEYQVTIPSLLTYIFNRSGVHPFFIDKAAEGHASYGIRQLRDERYYGTASDGQSITVGANTVKHRWAIKDVPAFNVENYLTTPINYIDRIEFQLHQTNNGETTTDVMPTWTKATERLLKEEDFGAALNDAEHNFWMDRALETIVKDKSTGLKAARQIYYYISGNFNCSSHYNKYITTSLQEVYRKHSGSVGELNLLLTALLNRIGLKADPVVLSTREFGHNYPDYPVMDRLNYVISRVDVDGQVYYLDASHPGLGFGKLPPSVYNGHARIISNTDSASVYFMADSIKEKKLTFVNIFNDSLKPGNLAGEFQIAPGYIESFSIREAVRSAGQAHYIEQMKANARGDVEFRDYAIDSLSQPEDPINVHGSFGMKLGDNTDILYFNPIMWAGYKTNPFEAAVRQYPVEMQYPINDQYFFSMEIPDGFAVDELPKPVKVVYNGGEGSFEYLVQQQGRRLQLRCSLAMKKAYFDATDYNSLRDFFAFVVKKQNEPIVFKKKK